MAAKKSETLLDKESKGIFNQYINRKDIGKQMLDSFMKNEMNKNPDGFVFEADALQVGVLTQCYGILTLAEYSKFNIDLGENKRVAAKINVAINDVLNRIHADSDELIFGATPYVNNETDVKDYIETISLVLRASLEVRRLLAIDYDNDRNTIELDNKYVHAPKGLTDEETTQLEIAFMEKLIVKCINALTDSALKANGSEGVDYYLKGDTEPLFDRNGKNMKYKGWSFTRIPESKHDKTETSLYFTYLVCDAYLAFYENFERSIRLVRRMRDNIRNAQTGEDVETANPENYGIDLSRLDEEKSRDFYFVKGIYHTFSKFNKAVLDAGHYVDTKFSAIDTTKDFFSYGFNLVTAQNIEESSTSDAIFNVMYAINILMAAGVDADYKDRGKELEFYDALQYSVPNAQRLYKKLARLGKEYVVEQYILKFNESIPADETDLQVSVRLLRKRIIVAANLMPLIIKTYNVLSKFLTPYPQYEMRVYKDYILQNKMEGEWLWDKDGYHLINNFNYVSALRNFYDYYEKYERPYAMDEVKYIQEKNAEIENIEFESARKLQKQREASRNVINDLKDKNKQDMDALAQEYEQKLAELKAERDALEHKKSPIEEEILRILKGNIDEILISSLNKIISANGRTTYQDEDLNTVFQRAFISYLSKVCDSQLDIYDGVVDEEGKKIMQQQYKDSDHMFETKVFETLCKTIEFMNARNKS